jgi:hypothetical protein
MRLLLMILFSGLFLVSTGQTIPNGDFENWTATGSYENPTLWSTPNATTAILSQFTVTKESSIKQSGNYSAKLQTLSLLGMQIPGLLTLGTFSINMVTMEAKIEGGAAFTHRPETMTGYAQYDPKFGDECFIGVVLLRQNGSTWDTLGTGDYRTTSALTSWTPFTININYTSSAQPTHLNIIILSSDMNSPQPNSTLYVDNLQFQYPIGVSETRPMNEPNAYFSQGNLMLEHLPAQHDPWLVQLFSLDGRLIYTETVHADGGTQILSNLPELPRGVYVVKATNSNNNLFTSKLVR